MIPYITIIPEIAIFCIYLNINLATGQRTFKYGGTQLWLSLDISVKQAPNVECFKRRLRKDLMLNVFKGHHLDLDVLRYHQHM